MSKKVAGKRPKAMERGQKQSAPQAIDSPGANNGLDLSRDQTPPEWLAAEQDSPQGDDRPLTRTSARVAPKGERASVFTSTISALAAALIGGIAWYWIEITGIYQGPWIAVALGLLMAVVVRIGSGGHESSYLGAVAVVGYLLTLLAVLLLITRRELLDVYGTIDGLQQYEDRLLSTRLRDPIHLLAYALGAFVTFQVTHLLRHR